jgi:hypothetical protein
LNTDEALYQLEQMVEKLEDVIYMARDLELNELAATLMMNVDDINEYHGLLERFGE